MNARQRAIKLRLSSIRSKLMVAESFVDVGQCDEVARYIREIHVLSQPDLEEQLDGLDALKRAARL